MTHWVLRKVNPTLISVFLEEVQFHLRGQDYEIYVDPQVLGVNKVLLKEEHWNYLISVIDQKFFYLSSSEPAGNDYYDFEGYMNYRKNISKVVIKEGSVVRLELDNLLYVVNSINLAKNTAVICRLNNNKTGLNFRVSLDVIVPTLKE